MPGASAELFGGRRLIRNPDNHFPEGVSVGRRLSAPEAVSLRPGGWGAGDDPGSLPRSASASPSGELPTGSSRGFGADASPSVFPHSLFFRAAPESAADYGTVHRDSV
jgi:hypothetical protein